MHILEDDCERDEYHQYIYWVEFSYALHNVLANAALIISFTGIVGSIGWCCVDACMIDFELVEEKLSSSIISDVLDGMGIRGQAMDTTIRPVQDDMIIVGYAATMLMSNQFDYSKDTFTVQFQAIDSLKEGEVMMVCSNGSERAALWGELLSTAARYRGATGAIIDGVARDISLIREMNFPVFHEEGIDSLKMGRNSLWFDVFLKIIYRSIKNR